MVKLRRLLYENYYGNTQIANNPIIKKRKPEIQMLYEELAYLIGSCFKDRTIDKKQAHELEDHMGSWKRRLMEAAQEAEDAVDMFLTSAIMKRELRDSFVEYKIEQGSPMHIKFVPGSGHEWIYPCIVFPTSKDYLLDCSLEGLKDVMGKLRSIKEETSNEKGDNVGRDIMTDEKIEAASTTCVSRDTRVNLSSIEHEEVIVGLEEDALLIIDRLTGYRKKLDIISIVGMAGLGKTTLATKIFNHSLVEYHFDKRGWVTVSQAYSKRDLLLQLLVSIGKSVHETMSESKLCQMLYKSLKGIKYLIVIDDIWSRKAWEDVGICFPDDNTGSRVLLTTRLTEVALHISRGGFTHNLQHLTEDQSWELLCRKTFRGHECPESLIETGKNIAKRCGGLPPLALVVIAGLLEKGEKRKDLWDKIAESVGSYVINDPKGCLDTLALSYDHLPSHLKGCFLYVGGFPEDHKIQVQMLIKLWMAEGFIRETSRRSLEEEGEYYLMDLIDRNLLSVAEKRSNGGIKSCRLHDLLRELCLTKASEENFFKKTSMSVSNNSSVLESPSNMLKQRRLFTNYEVLHKIYSHNYATYTRSVLCFHNSRLPEDRTTSWVFSFLLLRVFDLLNIPIADFEKIKSRTYDSIFEETNFCSLQTLIIKGKFQSFIYSGDNMVNLRHLRCDKIDFSTGFYARRLFHLQTISRLRLDYRAQCLLLAFPSIKKLGCSIFSASINHGLLSFAMLANLEALNIEKYMYDTVNLANYTIKFPETLKRLTIKGLCLPWSYTSAIQRLPKLEVLKLLESSFKGHLWDTGDEQFNRLKFLKLEKLNICVWEVSSINFPCLKKLVVRSCEYLKEIPPELGNIYTLEHITVDYSNSSVLESVNIIQEAQREMWNCDIRVNIIHKDPDGNKDGDVDEYEDDLDYITDLDNDVHVKESFGEEKHKQDPLVMAEFQGLGAVKKLNNSNYNTWSTCMSSFLQGSDLWEVVNGASTEEPRIDTNGAIHKWRVKVGRAMFILKTTVEDELLDHIRDLATPKLAWDALAALFSKRNDAKLQLLENELLSVSQKNQSIPQYFHRVKSLCREIGELDREARIGDARMKRIIVHGLKPEFRSYVAAIQGWPVQPSLVEFENLLAAQESLATQMAGLSVPDQVKKEDSALYVNRGKGKFRPNKNYKDQTDRKKKQWQHKPEVEGSETSDRKNQNKKFPYPCYNCGLRGHMSKNCPSKKPEEGNAATTEREEPWDVEANMAQVQEVPVLTVTTEPKSNRLEEWIIDSGCSNHLTGEKEKLSKCKKYIGDNVVVIADNSRHQIANIGEVHFQADGNQKEFVMQDVFHVPGMKKNLFSIPQITSTGKYVLFGPDNMQIFDKYETPSIPILQGKRTDTVYVLSAESAYVDKMSGCQTTDLWHARLSHVGFDKLELMVKNELVEGLPKFEVKKELVCAGCQFGKAHEQPYESSNYKAKEPLELIHSDVFGPVKQPSVDFMKEKSEVYEKFKLFKEEAERLMKCTVQRLRSDNGGEYLSFVFEKYLRENKIRRQLTCPNTPRQNGVSERTNRHLGETCRSIVHAKNVPGRFWAEAMRTAAYVINRLPQQ
ncbi:uncharacterized protein LOC143567386 [Bidens hawaiensis]|uniref:uncharacterized protein LOC143567386 n=1 Tax=Bidens hawaiensis TaxID=980011 RepID=UPI00404A4F7C